MNLYEIGKKKDIFILNSRILYDMSGENFGKITCWVIPATFICSILLFSYFKHVVSCGWHLQIAYLWRDEQMNNCRIFLCFAGFQCYAKNIPSSVSSSTSALSREAQPDTQAAQHTALFSQTALSQKTHNFWKLVQRYSVLFFRKD